MSERWTWKEPLEKRSSLLRKIYVRVKWPGGWCMKLYRSQHRFSATFPSNGSQQRFPAQLPAARIGFLSAQVLPNRSFWNSSFHTFPSSTVWTYSALISAVKQTFSITEMVNLLTLPTHNLSKCATPKIRKIPQNNETHERPKRCCWASTTGAKEIK